MVHRLKPMFEAKSIAIVGASEKANSFGMRLIKAHEGFQGRLDYINPKYQDIQGKACIAQITDLDYTPDLMILGVGSSRIEQALKDSIQIGAKSCVIYDDCHDEQETDHQLLFRLRAIAKEADMPVCGGNCMGFLNLTEHLFGSYYPADHLKAGNISLIAHSGSVFTVLAMSDYRYRFDLVISPGQEIGASIDEYIDYALNRPSTKVIALFMETARNPEAFLAALNKAREHQIPVVVCKVGATDESAKMAQSHTGAIAGRFTAYITAMESCGAIVVDTVDQLMNTALLCSQGRQIKQGGLATITDSGGLRETAIDRAEKLKTPLTRLSPQLKNELKAILPTSLLPSNPLDCLTGLSDQYEMIFKNAIQVFDQSEEIAIIGLECDFRDDFIYAPELFEIAQQLTKLTTKPCFLYSSFSQANNKAIAQQFADIKLPFLNGLDEVFQAVSYFLKWRDNLAFLAQADPIIELDKSKVAYWHDVLRHTNQKDEAIGLKLLADFGIETIQSQVCENKDELTKALNSFQYPLVLKTAEKDIQHKSDIGGVYLNINNQDEALQKYDQLTSNIGARVIVQSMAEKGLELSFGAVKDHDFNTMIMLSAGGILVELLEDRQFALAPFGIETARKMINNLKIARLMDGYRSQAILNKERLAHSLALFSSIAFQFQDVLSEIDINPIILDENTAIAVDCLMI